MTIYIHKQHSVDVRNSGFTLVELSIVLVIIGLIVGGIVGGQALIKSARAQTLITDMTTIQTGWNIFELQYDALPGDFAEATDYWPTSKYSWIENGDGNGKLEWKSSGAPADEPHNAFEHMIVAEILQGYLGQLGSRPTVGDAYGSSILDKSHFRIAYAASTPGNILKLILQKSGESGSFPLLNPAGMQKADKKLDDGLPGSGRLVAKTASVAGTPDCYDSATAYNLDESAKACYFWFDMD